ncbi:MAG: hypothetical protein E5X67_19455 [Mesorhizobium sp.]|uniref:hypothetical protein n=1 Tax=Mesorhizobium sp. TaxID=1871066 RepID=UPI0011FBD542|nr:hypothetical protein [Mesorhizobium sp.]TIP26593.1 MAG: hypothetical protein E5X67_19455 [Mesorhizobium sp.]
MTNHLERSHSIVLSGPVDRVFPLFTPIGETLWVDDRFLISTSTAGALPRSGFVLRDETIRRPPFSEDVQFGQ